MLKQKNKGFTLVEIAIVMTIVGLLVGGIWMAVATVIENKKRDDLSTSLLQAMINTKMLFSSNSYRQSPSPARLFYVSLIMGKDGFSKAFHTMPGAMIDRHGPIGRIINIAAIQTAAPVTTGTTGAADGFTNTTAIAMGIMPASLVVPGGFLHQPFAQSTTQDSITVTGTGNSVQFIVGSSNVNLGLPPDVCTVLATTIGSQANINHLNITTIVMNTTTAPVTNGVPNAVTPGVAAAACTNPGTTNTFEVDFSVP